MKKYNFIYSYGKELYSARALKEILEAEFPCEIHLAPDVTAMEEVFARLDEVDLLLYDSPPPALSCARSVQRLRQFSPGLPAILLTAIPDLLNANGNTAATPFNEVIAKPVNWQELLQKIKLLLKVE